MNASDQIMVSCCSLKSNLPYPLHCAFGSRFSTSRSICHFFTSSIIVPRLDPSMQLGRSCKLNPHLWSVTRFCTHRVVSNPFAKSEKAPHLPGYNYKSAIYLSSPHPPSRPPSSTPAPPPPAQFFSSPQSYSSAPANISRGSCAGSCYPGLPLPVPSVDASS